MDIGTLRGLGTLMVMVAFLGLNLWVFSRRRDRDFDEARLLPFADDLPPTAQRSGTPPCAPSPAARNERP